MGKLPGKLAGRTEGWITKKTNTLLKGYAKLGIWFYKVSDKFTSGIPDFIGVCNGRFFAIELKRPGGKAGKLQLFILDRIDRAGGATLVTDDFNEVKSFITSLLKQKYT